MSHAKHCNEEKVGVVRKVGNAESEPHSRRQETLTRSKGRCCHDCSRGGHRERVTHMLGHAIGRDCVLARVKFLPWMDRRSRWRREASCKHFCRFLACGWACPVDQSAAAVCKALLCKSPAREICPHRQLLLPAVSPRQRREGARKSAGHAAAPLDLALRPPDFPRLLAEIPAPRRPIVPPESDGDVGLPVCVLHPDSIAQALATAKVLLGRLGTPFAIIKLACVIGPQRDSGLQAALGVSQLVVSLARSARRGLLALELGRYGPRLSRTC